MRVAFQQNNDRNVEHLAPARPVPRMVGGVGHPPEEPVTSPFQAVCRELVLLHVIHVAHFVHDVPRRLPFFNDNRGALIIVGHFSATYDSPGADSAGDRLLPLRFLPHRRKYDQQADRHPREGALFKPITCSHLYTSCPADGILHNRVTSRQHTFRLAKPLHRTVFPPLASRLASSRRERELHVFHTLRP